jgi:transposase
MAQERLTLRKIREILRLKEEAGLSHRAIARACKISNSTVGDYLRRAETAGIHWPLPEEVDEDQLFRKLFGETPEAPPALRPLPDWEKVRDELKKKGVTLKLLWQEYRGREPQGYGYSQYCEYYHRWRKAQSPSARFVHRGGEELEVDYAGLTVTIVNPETGETHQAPVFVATLPASQYVYTEVQPSQALCYWIGGHVRSFEYIGGVPKIVRPDNPRTGVTSPNYYEPDLNPTYQEMAEYYQVAVLPARVRKPKDKPSIENGVQNVERWVIAPLRDRTFFSEEEANRAMTPLREALNQRPMVNKEKSRRQFFEELDQPELRPLPEHPYEFAEWKTVRVNIDYHVAFEKHYYSVPNELIHQQVEIRATEHLVRIFHKGKQVALHPRSRVPGRYSTCPDHMPSNHRFVHELDAEWLLHQAEKIGPQTAAYLTALMQSRPFPEQAYRSCLGVLSLARKYPPADLESACQCLQEAHLWSYRDVKGELERRAPQPEPVPLKHENIRGEAYYVQGEKK